MSTLRPRYGLSIVVVALSAPQLARSDSVSSSSSVCSSPTVAAFVAETGSHCFVRRAHGSKKDKASHPPVLHEPLAAGDRVECVQASAVLVITNCGSRENKRITYKDMRSGSYVVPSVSPEEPEEHAVKEAARLAHIPTGSGTPHGATTTGPGKNAGLFPGISARPGWSAAPHRTSLAFAGHPTPAGGHEIHTANGGAIRTRADGSRSDIHDARRGMDIHHGLDGNRLVVVDRADHSRIVAERGGQGYVQRPYVFGGQEFVHRTYMKGSHVYSRFYTHYLYHGVSLDVYVPLQYYPIGFYKWLDQPWVAPVQYSWGWATNPWYAYYGFYFAPAPVYPSPAYWQTDYMLALSLQSAYTAQTNVQVPVEGSAVVLTPEVKDQIAGEVQSYVRQESFAAQANATEPRASPAYTGVAALLEDGRRHALVAALDLDTLDTSGHECMLTRGDVIQVQGAPAPDAREVNATVLASKGSHECAPSAEIIVALTDLQEMQNAMREAIDRSLQELRNNQGQGRLPALPADASAPPVAAEFAVDAPPPDEQAGVKIAAQASAADQAEQEVTSAALAGPPATIALGQTPDQVQAAIGNPTTILVLGAKKIYIYSDMKITFMNGTVTDIQ